VISFEVGKGDALLRKGSKKPFEQKWRDIRTSFCDRKESRFHLSRDAIVRHARFLIANGQSITLPAQSAHHTKTGWNASLGP